MTVFNGRTENSREDWGTPDWIFEALDNIFHFNIDLAASAENNKCGESRMWLGPGSPIAEDALSISWANIAETCERWWAGDVTDLRGFLNPPFLGPNGEHWMGQWMQKAYEETREQGFVVALIRFSPDTDWWHDTIIGKATMFPYFRGRVNYVKEGETSAAKAGSNFPSQVVLFHPDLTLHRPKRKGRA